MLLNRDLLTDNTKTPVDPKFWNRMDRGEDTDNPPHGDNGPPPNSEGLIRTTHVRVHILYTYVCVSPKAYTHVHSTCMHPQVNIGVCVFCCTAHHHDAC